MPYIQQEDRKALDGAIDTLSERIAERAGAHAHDAAFAGLLNYAMTRVALGVIKRRYGKIKYWIVAVVSGVFKNAGDEFYRRLGAPYEDRQIAANGDVDLYQELEQEMKNGR